MSTEADRSRRSYRDVRSRKDRTAPRPVGEVLRDLDQERGRLVDAIDQLKVEASATRARLLSPRTFAIAGGALVALVALRRRRKKR
jgi:hypothetical protein